MRNAGRVVLAAGAFGLVGQLLFFDVGLGVNFPIAIAFLLLGGWLVRQRSAQHAVLDLWLAPAALVFAIFVALRGDPTIAALDVLTALTLTGAALASFGGRPVVARPFWSIAGLAVSALGWVVAGSAAALAAARRAMPAGASRQPSPAMPVLRGLAIAVPIVLVFVALFSSADAVFARLVDDVFGLEIDAGDAVWRLVLAAVLAW
ncbi:MAG: hypothetical protein M3Y29_04950, partial [Chloroflexota bacterium]|nr:hypothetical protein [Chloroflexota bacterium]